MDSQFIIFVESVLQQHRPLVNELYHFSHPKGVSIQAEVKRHAWQTMLVKKVLETHQWCQVEALPEPREVVAQLREQAMQWYAIGR